MPDSFGYFGEFLALCPLSADGLCKAWTREELLEWRAVVEDAIHLVGGNVGIR